jgi:diketogulonate reductase-like aldo/keto reductase
MTPEQIHSNATAAAWELTPADLSEVDALLAQ